MMPFLEKKAKTSYAPSFFSVLIFFVSEMAEARGSEAAITGSFRFDILILR